LDRVIGRAEQFWELDRRSAAEDLGARLSKDPARIARALRRSRQGADWLIERWDALARIARLRGPWNEDQIRLALDLLGVAPELRQGSERVSDDDASAQVALAEREAARLRKEQADVLDDLDESDRAMTEAGMPIGEDATSARLRRYEASCRRVFNSAHSELRQLRER